MIALTFLKFGKDLKLKYLSFVEMVRVFSGTIFLEGRKIFECLGIYYLIFCKLRRKLFFPSAMITRINGLQLLSIGLFNSYKVILNWSAHPCE